MVARNDLMVLNTGWEMTFRRRAEGAIIDLTIAVPRLTSMIDDWCVLEVTTLSDHQCLEFSKLERSHPSWNTRRFSKDKLREYLEESRLFDGLRWAKCAELLGDTVRTTRRKVVAACDHSMLRREHRRT